MITQTQADTLPLTLLMAFHSAHNQRFADRYWKLKNDLAEGKDVAAVKSEFDAVTRQELEAITSELNQMHTDLEGMKATLSQSFDSLTTGQIILELSRAQTTIKESIAEKKASFKERIERGQETNPDS